MGLGWVSEWRRVARDDPTQPRSWSATSPALPVAVMSGPAALPHHAQMGMSIPAHVSQNQAVTFVRLVNQSKGSGTDQLAFDEPQLRRRCPVGEEPPAPAHDVGQH